jgi:ABC-type nitrate/sulfonate/bicarbonate transport system substrate-binding protein
MVRHWLLVLLLSGCSAGGAAPPGERAPAPAIAGAATATAETRPAPQRIRIGVPGPSLSYLPAQVAWLLGYFEEEGLEPEFVLTGGTTIIPALLSGELDFTTVLSAIGAHAGQGGASRIVQFHAVRLQHVLGVRPEITSIGDLSGRRVAVQSLGTLTAFEVQMLAEHFGLRDVAIIAVGTDLERIAAMEAGAADATIETIPLNLIAERRGFPSLLRVGTVLQIPQAGLGTSESHLREKSDLVTRSLRAAARALPVITTQRELVVQQIARWIDLSPEDAALAYDQVADSYSPNGLPTDAQMAAYRDLLVATAGIPASTTPAQLADFTIARQVATELGLPGP